MTTTEFTASALTRQELTDRKLAAQGLLSQALAEAYQDRDVPDGIMDLLASQRKPGRVCGIFFAGRSGSFLLQSFFDEFVHPQVLTAHPVGLCSFDLEITQDWIDDFNRNSFATNAAVEEGCHRLLRRLFYLFTKVPGHPALDQLCVPEQLLTKFVLGQLLLLEPSTLTHDTLLKILFLSYRLTRGGPIATDKLLVYLWQAHTPSPERKLWMKRAFDRPYLLTMVRLPEKALDSHLIHHGYESVSPPFHTLFRRLFFEHLCVNDELVSMPFDRREWVLRFEDLHRHTADVLQALCNLIEVPYYEGLSKNQFTLSVRGKPVTGTRTLGPNELEPRLLNRFDRLKVRYLMQEEYRVWGYESFCAPGLQASIEEYLSEPLAQSVPFGAHMILGGPPDTDLHGLLKESFLHKELFHLERKRRDQGIVLTPLLYRPADMENSPAARSF